MDHSNDEAIQTTEEWIDNEIKDAMTKTLPAASREQYVRTYEKFQAWRVGKRLEGPSNEKELFAFLHHKLETNKWVSPGTLWSRFSMLRSMIHAKEGLDIKTTNINSTIQTWLKRVGTTYKTKQAFIFTKEQVRRFIKEAPEGAIVQKLVLLVGVYTGLRCDTLTRLEWRHVQMRTEQVSIFVDYESKTDQGAQGMWFALPKAADDTKLDPYNLFNQYKQILEKKDKELTKARLWLRVDESKDGSYRVTKQVRGIEWVSSVPAKVSKWLNLPESEKYTGHSLRRTCAQWATDNGMTDTQMQHHFGWKSAAMVVRYSRSSECLKQAMARSLNMEEDGKSKSKENNEGGLPCKENGHSYAVQTASANESSTKRRRSASSDGNSDEKRAKEAKTWDRRDVIFLESEKPSKARQPDDTYRDESTSACAEGASSKANSARVSGEVASPPSPPGSNISSTMASLFSGCTFGNVNFNINIQHNASPSVVPATVDRREMMLENTASAPLPIVGNMPRLKLLFKEKKDE
jgi:integrase